jgi:hypothetical protein
MVGRPPGLLGGDAIEADPVQIQRVDDLHCVVVRDSIFETFRQQRQLRTIGGFDETPHRHLLSFTQESCQNRALSHSEDEERPLGASAQRHERPLDFHPERRRSASGL